MPLLTIPPSKVRPQCKAIRQKVCKSCEHVFRAKRSSEHTPINYWRMRYIYFRTRACIWYSRMRPIYKLAKKRQGFRTLVLFIHTVPLLTCLGSQSPELVYTCLQHIQLLLAKEASIFADNYQTFFCRYICMYMYIISLSFNDPYILQLHLYLMQPLAIIYDSIDMLNIPLP